MMSGSIWIGIVFGLSSLFFFILWLAALNEATFTTVGGKKLD